MKIVILSMQFPPVLWDGVGAATSEISRALAARGHEVHVLSCLPGQEHSDEERDGVHAHRRPMVIPGPGRALRLPVLGLGLRAALRLSRGRDFPSDGLVRRLNQAVSCWVEYRRLGVDADVVVSNESDGLALGFVLRRTGPPVAITAHGPGMLRTRLWGRLTLRGRIADRIDRFGAHRADALVVPSQLLADTLAGSGWLVGREPVVVHNPFDATLWEPTPSADGTEPLVLAVGRIEPTKGVDHLVDAARLLTARVPGARVVVAGGYPVAGGGRRWAREVLSRNAALGSPVEFVGEVGREDLRDLYHRARVVVVPSRLDMFPTVVWEAAASGRAVVCSESVGMAAIVAQHGAGAVVPTGDVAALANSLTEFCTDPQRAGEAGRRARALVEQLVAPEVIGEQLERLYRQVAAKRRVTPA